LFPGQCGAELETPQGLVEQTVKCPACGLVNYVPGFLPSADPLSELARVVDQDAAERPVVRASTAIGSVKRIKPLFSLGILRLLFLVGAVVVLVAGSYKSSQISAHAAFTSDLNSSRHISEGWSDMAIAAARGGNPNYLSQSLSEMKDNRDVESEYDRARQVESTSQMWAAVLAVLGLILAVLGFSYSQDQFQNMR
jgi:hypothetical protein